MKDSNRKAMMAKFKGRYSVVGWGGGHKVGYGGGHEPSIRIETVIMAYSPKEAKAIFDKKNKGLPYAKTATLTRARP